MAGHRHRNPTQTLPARADSGQLWILAGLSLLAACGGGGGSGFVVRNTHFVHNGSTIFDEDDPTLPADVRTHRNGVSATIDPADNIETQFRTGLEELSMRTVAFDADYSITVAASGGATAPTLPMNQIPARLKEDRITPPDTPDGQGRLNKDAWTGVVFVADEKALAEFFYNTNTGQQDLVVNEVNVNSLVAGENFDFVVSFIVTVRTLVVGGEDLLERFFTEAGNVRMLERQGIAVDSDAKTLTQEFTYRFVGRHDTPQSRDGTIDARGDIAVTGRFDEFLVSHFHFLDNDEGHQLVRLEILRTPDHGSLTVERPSEEPIPVGVVGRVARDDIVHLVYTPHDVPMDDSFEFRVSDGFASGGHHTITLDVV